MRRTKIRLLQRVDGDGVKYKIMIGKKVISKHSTIRAANKRYNMLLARNKAKFGCKK